MPEKVSISNSKPFPNNPNSKPALLALSRQVTSKQVNLKLKLACVEDLWLTLGSRGVVTSLLARSGNDNPQRLYKYIIKSNIVNKRAPLKMQTGAKKGSPIVPSKSKLKL